MSDILIVHQFENMIITVFGMHFDFIILHVFTIMEVPLLRLQIEPCLKWVGLLDWKANIQCHFRQVIVIDAFLFNGVGFMIEQRLIWIAGWTQRIW